MNVGDFVQVNPQPTVVRLEHLGGKDSQWITANYFITDEVEAHFKALRHLFSQDHGAGVFVIGHYGSGKSHFLAYLAQQLNAGTFSEKRISVAPVSLLHFGAGQSLEAILRHSLNMGETGLDRRVGWNRLMQERGGGLLLLLDELSEFLRSKPDTRQFNEDIRFLQFLGEFSQDRPLWILAALQEQIEHTGEMEYDLFRKIKDRYPSRLILSPTHVRNLIGNRILIKKEGYAAEVEKLIKQLRTAFPENPLDYAELAKIYPLHPACMEILEEVRDRFSQARGIVGFTLHQLLGEPSRGLAPFLDQPWGRLIGPDAVVDYFRDLFEVQPEFLPLAQKLFPYYRKHMPGLFPKEGVRHLAERLLKLLVLVHLSPARESLGVEEAAWWLLHKVSTLEPERNRKIIQNILDRFCDRGAYIKKTESRYTLDLREDGRDALENLIARRLKEANDSDETVLESLTSLLPGTAFNPFGLKRDHWVKHKVTWHFHEWDVAVFFGGGAPTAKDTHALQIGLPWGTPAHGMGCYRLQPKPLELSGELRELAALAHLRESALPKQVLAAVRERMASRLSLFTAQLENAYRQATFTDHAGAGQTLAGDPVGHDIRDWIRKYAVLLLRQTYPRFEIYAPSHGPLPKEAYRQLMSFCLKHDLSDRDAPDLVAMIREAYLVPMKLVDRQAGGYAISSKLDRHELVTILRPILAHQPSPKRFYQHLATPVYGLVPDQVHLLLLVLMIQGEIDILKGRSSYRDLYESMPIPLLYDRIVPGKALDLNQLRDLQILCEGLAIPINAQANVLAQRRCARQLRVHGRKQRDRLSEFTEKLRVFGDSEELVSKIEGHINCWAALEKGENELQGVRHFLFEIGSPRRFLETHHELSGLPQKVERLVAETQRLQHLIRQPAYVESANAEVRLSVEHLGDPPGLDESDALEGWLDSANRMVDGYKTWYRARHDAWWRDLKAKDLWKYDPPALAQSRHLGLAGTVADFERGRETARAKFCRGLGNLDFQALCPCGFNGAEAPVAEDAARLESLREELETALTRFFGRDEVASKVREWFEKGLERDERTATYLEGERAYPVIGDLSLFDRHLTGLTLYREVAPETLLDLLGDKVWETEELMRAIRGLLGKYGPRVSFSKTETPAEREQLVAWCLKMALNHGVPLPRGFGLRERQSFAGLIRHDWVSIPALDRLDRLGLGEEAEHAVLKWVLDGAVPLDGVEARSGPVAAAAVLRSGLTLDTADRLAAWSAVLYREHPRMMWLAPETWIGRLDELAKMALPEPPPALFDLLPGEMAAQWLIVDCLGLPLLPCVTANLEEWLPDWRLARTRFALVSTQTDTSAFYRGLSEGPTQKAFHKINAVDALVHEHTGPLGDLEKRVQAELAVHLRNLKNLDPAKELLIFADHGFRLDKSGKRYIHGGDSTLERLVPVLFLKPYR